MCSWAYNWAEEGSGREVDGELADDGSEPRSYPRFPLFIYLRSTTDGLFFKVRVTFGSTAFRLLLEHAILLLAVMVLVLRRLLLLVLLLLTLGFLLLGKIALDLFPPLPTREARSTLSALATYSYV